MFADPNAAVPTTESPRTSAMDIGGMSRRAKLHDAPGLGYDASSRAGSGNPVADRGLEYAEGDDAKSAELDAVAGHPGLAEFLAIGLRQVRLVVEPHDVDRDPGRVATQTDLIELAGAPIG